MSKTKEMVAEPKTENVCGEYNPDYQVCYKSTLLNKVFDSTEELREAEAKYHEENDAKLKLAETKKAREKFIEDYGYYHESYYSDGKNEIVTISDVIDSFFKPWF